MAFQLNETYDVAINTRGLGTIHHTALPKLITINGVPWKEFGGVVLTKDPHQLYQFNATFYISLPTMYETESRHATITIRDLQSVHAEGFFREHKLKFVAEGKEIRPVGVRKSMADFLQRGRTT